MSSIINAGTSGLVLTGSTTTTLSLATNGTTRATIDASGNVSLASGNLTFSSTGQRITGDFSNATLTSRLAFQTSTTDGATRLMVLPNGTSTTSAFNLLNTSDANNASYLTFACESTVAAFRATNVGTGTLLPMTWVTGGSERMRLTTDGNLGLGTASPGTKLDVAGNINVGASGNKNYQIATDSNGLFLLDRTNTRYPFKINAGAYDDALVIGSTGNVGIGTASPGTRLAVSSATNAGISVTDGTVTTIMYNSTGGVGSIGTTSNHSVNLLTNNATRVTVTNGGHVSMTGRLGVNGASTDATFVLAVQAGRTSLAANSETYALGVRYASSTGIYYIGATNSATPDLVFSQVGGSERARLTNAGGFSVGTTADPGAGAIFATGNITAYYSDARLKDFKGKIGGALDKVSQLNGYYYTENAKAEEFGYNNKAMQVGVSAQEVKAVLPEVVSAAPFDLDEKGESKSGENYMTVNYEKLVPLLIEAIKELTAKVEALEGKR
jgi:hypothetical protein